MIMPPEIALGVLAAALTVILLALNLMGMSFRGDTFHYRWGTAPGWCWAGGLFLIAPAAFGAAVSLAVLLPHWGYRV